MLLGGFFISNLLRPAQQGQDSTDCGRLDGLGRLACVEHPRLKEPDRQAQVFCLAEQLVGVVGNDEPAAVRRHNSQAVVGPFDTRHRQLVEQHLGLEGAPAALILVEELALEDNQGYPVLGAQGRAERPGGAAVQRDAGRILVKVH